MDFVKNTIASQGDNDAIKKFQANLDPESKKQMNKSFLDKFAG